MAHRHDPKRLGRHHQRRGRHQHDSRHGFHISAKAGVTSAVSFAPSEGFAGVGSTTSGSQYRLQPAGSSTGTASPSSSTAGTTDTAIGTGGSVGLHWTSTTRPPRSTHQAHPTPILGELDVPGKTSTWNHKHLVRGHARPAAAHRRPH